MTAAWPPALHSELPIICRLEGMIILQTHIAIDFSPNRRCFLALSFAFLLDIPYIRIVCLPAIIEISRQLRPANLYGDYAELPPFQEGEHWALGLIGIIHSRRLAMNTAWSSEILCTNTKFDGSRHILGENWGCNISPYWQLQGEGVGMGGMIMDDILQEHFVGLIMGDNWGLRLSG